MRQFVPALLGSRLQALQGSRNMEEMSQLSGIEYHTYRRILLGQMSKVGIDDAMKLARVHHLTPNEFMALAELWEVPEKLSREEEINRLLEILGNYLVDLSPERRVFMIDLVTTLLRVDQSQNTPGKKETTEHLLPDWLRNRSHAQEPEEVSPETPPS